jgi:glycosyltransferase involved in cell wall biosynthesis
LAKLGQASTLHTMKNSKKQRNILQVTAALQEGGVERGTVEMAAYTQAQGYNSFVASFGGRMESDLVSSGSTHYKLPLHKRNPFYIIYNGFKLASFIKRNDIDLVHARSRAPAWAAVLACKLTGVPYVTTFHGTHKIQNRAKKLYNSSMVRGLRVIAISQFIKDHIIHNYGIEADKIDIAHRGINPDNFNPDRFSADEIKMKRAELNLGNKFVITLPGRLTRWKGQVEFIEALASMKDDDTWHGLLVGGYSKKKTYYQELKLLVFKYGLENRITFAGSQKDVAVYYALSNLIVSASNEPEAFGRVAIEGGAMRKCVVATAHGGSLETVKDNETGYLVPPLDVQSMAKILRRVLKDKGKTKLMGENGYTWVQNTFTVERMCHSEWVAYIKILGEE